MPVCYLTIKKFSAESGYSPDAIRAKIVRGDWLRDQNNTHFCVPRMSGVFTRIYAFSGLPRNHPTRSAISHRQPVPTPHGSSAQFRVASAETR